MPTSARFSLPVAQWMDGSGDPLSGGELRFYESGTTTPLDVYQDAALTTAFTQPVTADADGVWPEIWLQPRGYKVELQDSSSSVIWTADPVQTDEPLLGDIGGLQALPKPTVAVRQEVASFAELGDEGGGHFVWDPSDTTGGDATTIFAASAGGTGRWRRELPGPVRPEMAGAKADGMSGTAAEFNNAAKASASRKRSLQLGGGTQLVDLPTGGLANLESLKITGYGRGLSILAPASGRTGSDSNNSTLFINNVDDVELSSFCISGFAEVGEDTHRRYRCLVLESCKRVVLRDLAAMGAGLYDECAPDQDTNGQLIFLRNCEDVLIDGLWMHGVGWNEPLPGWDYRQQWTGARELLVIGYGCRRVIGKNIFAQHTTDTFVLVNNGGSSDDTTPEHVHLVDMIFDNRMRARGPEGQEGASFGVDVFAARNVTIERLRLLAEDDEGLPHLQKGVYGHPKASSEPIYTNDLRVVDLYARGCATYGVHCTGGRNFSVVRADVKFNGYEGSIGVASSATNTEVADCRIEGSGGSAVYARGGIFSDCEAIDWDRDQAGLPAYQLHLGDSMNSVLIGSEAHLVAQESNPPERYFWGTSNDLLTIPNLTIAECRGYGVDFPVVPNAVSEFDVGRIWSDQMPMGANSRISADEGSTVDVRGFNRVLVSNSGAGRQNIDTLIGIPGQVVTLVFQDSGSSIQDSGVGSGNIKLASGAAFDPDLDDTLQLVVQSATAVLEIARSDN